MYSGGMDAGGSISYPVEPGGVRGKGRRRAVERVFGSWRMAGGERKATIAGRIHSRRRGVPGSGQEY